MRKILAIDDEPPVLRCLETVLESRGYKLEVFDDPVEGLRKAKEDPDVVLLLLDVKMPGMNGFDLYKDLLRSRQMPVLFVTAYPRSFNAKSEDVAHMWQEHFAAGTTDILYKPFDLEVLFEKVEGLIGPADEEDSDP